MNTSKQLEIESIPNPTIVESQTNKDLSNLTRLFQNHKIHFIEFENQILINNKDVCDYLEYHDARAVMRRLDEDEKFFLEIRLGSTGLLVRRTESQTQGQWYINESGLYRLVIGSIKPEAQKFRKWVTSEVLPSIRKTGQYNTIPLPTDPTDIALMLADQLRAERDKRLETEKTLAIATPKAESFDKLMNSDGCFLMGDVAKIIHSEKHPCGSIRLFEFLRKNGYLNKKNIPYQKYCDLQWFKEVAKTREHPKTGEHIAYSQIYVTPHGIEVIRKLWEGK